MKTATLSRPTAKEQPVSRRKIEVLVGLLFLWCTITFAIGNMLNKSYFSGGHPGSGTLVAGVLL